MTPESAWHDRLQSASDALERSPGAPPWLKAALRNALTVAEDLAPRAEPEREPTPFFYPH
jgi:hypothetical protein